MKKSKKKAVPKSKGACNDCGNTEEPCMCSSGRVGRYTGKDRDALMQALDRLEPAMGAAHVSAFPENSDPVAAVRWMIGQYLLWVGWWVFTMLCLGSLTALIACR